NVHARNLDAIFLREHGDHFAALAQILAGDHLDGIALLDPLHVRNPLLRYYRVSGARDAIFKKPLSRSSRATGPKTRVPRGFCRSSFRITAALSSKRMYEPSLRRYSLATRTITARTISLFLTLPCAVADFTVATTMSPTEP